MAATVRHTIGSVDRFICGAIRRNVGARGLRIILEELMLDLMYQLPQSRDPKELAITKEMVVSKEAHLPFEKAG